MIDDFGEFMHVCQQRGMRVLIALVVNRTANEPSWFPVARSRIIVQGLLCMDEEEAEERELVGIVFLGVPINCTSANLP
jgi:hypothetical protein